MNELIPQFPVICFGEIYWDATSEGVQPGGMPVRLAYHLRKLGLQAGIITRAGMDPQGKKLIELLESWNIPTDLFQLDDNLPTGKVQPDDEDNLELHRSAAWDNIAMDAAFTGLLSSSRFFVFGSLAARRSISCRTLYELLEIAPYKVFDMNLHPPYFLRNVITQLLKKTDLLRLNRDELELITGWFADYSTEADRMKLLQARFDIPKIVVMNKDNSSLLDADGNFSSFQNFPGNILDKRGSQDAFLAGLLYQTLQHSSQEDTFLFARAMASLVASREGPCPEYTVIELNKINTDNNSASLPIHN